MCSFRSSVHMKLSEIVFSDTIALIPFKLYILDYCFGQYRVQKER